MASREERRRDLFEMLADGSEGLGEASLDGAVEVVSQLGELIEAALEIRSLRGELRERLLLALVLLGGERIDAPELLASASQTLEPLGDRLAVVALCRLRPSSLESPLSLVPLGLEPG